MGMTEEEWEQIAELAGPVKPCEVTARDLHENHLRTCVTCKDERASWQVWQSSLDAEVTRGMAERIAALESQLTAARRQR